MLKIFRRILTSSVIALAMIAGFMAAFPELSAAAPLNSTTISIPRVIAIQSCGDKANGGPVKVSIDLGCSGKGNPILDMLFGIIRWLSDGVGLVVIASVIVGGIQYTASRDNPQASAAAVKRLQSALTALLIFFFSYAILNYLIPGALL